VSVLIELKRWTNHNRIDKRRPEAHAEIRLIDSPAQFREATMAKDIQRGLIGHPLIADSVLQWWAQILLETCLRVCDGQLARFITMGLAVQIQAEYATALLEAGLLGSEYRPIARVLQQMAARETANPGWYLGKIRLNDGMTEEEALFSEKYGPGIPVNERWEYSWTVSMILGRFPQWFALQPMGS